MSPMQTLDIEQFLSQQADQARHDSNLDAVDGQILANIRNVMVEECLIGHDTKSVADQAALKDLLFAVAFSLVARPFGQDFERLPLERAEALYNVLLHAMALDITSIENPAAATADEIKDALYAQTRQVAELCSRR